jgi:hypothetical protein
VRAYCTRERSFGTSTKKYNKYRILVVVIKEEEQHGDKGPAASFNNTIPIGVAKVYIKT